MTPQETRERLDALRTRKTAARDKKATAVKAKRLAEHDHDDDAVAIAEATMAAAHDEIERVAALENAVFRSMTGGSADFGQDLRNNLEAHRALAEIAGSAAPLNANVAIGPVMSMQATLGLFGQALASTVEFPDSPTPSRSSYGGIVPSIYRPTTLLDLFGAKPFEGRTLDFLRRENGVANAGVQIEGAVKPHADLEYVPDSTQAFTCASWIKSPRQWLDDVEGLLADIQEALKFGVMVAVEELLVHGVAASGTPGLLTASGSLAPDVSGADNLADAAAIMFRDLRLTGVTPNFLAVGPTEYTAEETRATSGSGEYVHPHGLNGQLWGVPVVQSSVLGDGEIGAGDSKIAGYLGVRSPVSAVVGQESDDMVRNMVTILVETRVAPVVEAPGALAIATLEP